MPQSRRLKGTGGLWQRTQTRLNPRTGELETIEVWQAAKEVPHPTHETKRKWVTGTGSTPTEANKKLSKNLERYYQKLSIPQPASAAIRHGGQSLQNYLEEWIRELDPNRVSSQLQRKYAQYMRNHVIPHCGSIPIKDLSYQHLKNLFDVTLPAKTKLDVFEVWIKYNMRLLSAEGDYIADWVVTSYGKTPQETFRSVEASINEAAVVALRDLASSFSLSFTQVPEVRDWLNTL